VPKQAANQQPDELTRIIQKKFYNHQSTLFNTILESYEKILENQEHLYALLLITRIPTKTVNKSFADQCKATKRLIPVNIPNQITTTSYQSTTFLQNTKEKLAQNNSYFRNTNQPLKHTLYVTIQRTNSKPDFSGIAVAHTQCTSHHSSPSNTLSQSEPNADISSPTNAVSHHSNKNSRY
jgi:hypothetical protein